MSVASCGRPTGETEVLVVDEHGHEVSGDAMGEIVIRGADVFHGYWGAPELTREVLVDGWLRTGDLARVVHARTRDNGDAEHRERALLGDGQDRGARHALAGRDRDDDVVLVDEQGVDAAVRVEARLDRRGGGATRRGDEGRGRGGEDDERQAA